MNSAQIGAITETAPAELRERVADELCRQRAGISGEQARALDGDYWNKQLANADRICALFEEADGPRITGRDIHREWRDGMLAQGRRVAPERMAWETLTDQDRQRDDRIAERLAAISSCPRCDLCQEHFGAYPEKGDRS